MNTYTCSKARTKEKKQTKQKMRVRVSPLPSQGFINLPSICKKLKTGRKLFLFLFLFLYIIKMWIYNVGFLPVEKFPDLMKGENNFSVRFFFRIAAIVRTSMFIIKNMKISLPIHTCV
jgi:hypothetical protein